MHNYILIGGDKRQRLLYEKLLSENKKVAHVSEGDKLRDVTEYTDIVLPLPLSRDGVNIYSSDSNFILSLEDVTEKICSSHTVYGGGIPDKIKASLKQRGIKCFDYMLDEEFLKANAELTAQGALRLLLENTEKFLPGREVLIIGFGRVAKALAVMLGSLGIKIYIAARSAQKVAAAGFDIIDIVRLKEHISRFDYIFGTVPCNVIRQEEIANIRDSALYFELASAPFTASREDFIQQNKKHIDGGALPGKFLAEASAEIIAQYISSRSD